MKRLLLAFSLAVMAIAVPDATRLRTSSSVIGFVKNNAASAN